MGVIVVVGRQDEITLLAARWVRNRNPCKDLLHMRSRVFTHAEQNVHSRVVGIAGRSVRIDQDSKSRTDHALLTGPTPQRTVGVEAVRQVSGIYALDSPHISGGLRAMAYAMMGTMATKKPGEYGYEDTSLRTLGGEAGVGQLVAHFYDLMATLPQARELLAMHPDVPLARAKLVAFLTGWLGGPKRYRERWGPIRIPQAHAHLAIGQAEHDVWLECMDGAIARMDVPEDFRDYFKEAIRVPARKVLTRATCGEGRPREA